MLIAWSYIAGAIFENDIFQIAAVDRNLDTGKDATGSYVYWKDGGSFA